MCHSATAFGRVGAGGVVSRLGSFFPLGERLLPAPVVEAYTPCHGGSYSYSSKAWFDLKLRDFD